MSAPVRSLVAGRLSLALRLLLPRPGNRLLGRQFDVRRRVLRESLIPHLELPQPLHRLTPPWYLTAILVNWNPTPFDMPALYVKRLVAEGGSPSL